MDKAKFERVMGVIGTITAVLMYVYYIITINNYLNAAPGSQKDWMERRDWPVAIANAPGIVFGGVTAIIALM